MLSGTQGKSLKQSLSNYWGHLAQGNVIVVKGVSIIVFVRDHEPPKDKKVTRANFSVIIVYENKSNIEFE